jgi:hypothetical protein
MENGTRRDLAQGQKAAIYVEIQQASAAWIAAHHARQEDANQRRSAAMMGNAHAEKQTFAPVQTSVSAPAAPPTPAPAGPPRPPNHAHTAVAHAIGVGQRTVAGLTPRTTACSFCG